jgi:hypothetical protein
MIALPALVLSSLLALADAPATTTAPPPPPGPPTHLSGVEVVAGPGPKLVSSFPAEGATAPAGVIVLKLVFDQPMTADAWSFGHAATGAFPTCLAHPRLLADQKTFVLLCTVEPRTDYAVQINPTPVFASAGGRSASPYLLRFSTSDDSTRNLHDALVQADLTDDDDPIMGWNDGLTGVSSSAADAAPKP